MQSPSLYISNPNMSISYPSSVLSDTVLQTNPFTKLQRIGALVSFEYQISPLEFLRCNFSQVSP